MIKGSVSSVAEPPTAGNVNSGNPFNCVTSVTHQDITLAQVYAALAYYYDHKAEIEKDIEDNHVEPLMARYGLKLEKDGRLIAEEVSER